jgi:hypothetical protein
VSTIIDRSSPSTRKEICASTRPSTSPPPIDSGSDKNAPASWQMHATSWDDACRSRILHHVDVCGAAHPGNASVRPQARSNRASRTAGLGCSCYGCCAQTACERPPQPADIHPKAPARRIASRRSGDPGGRSHAFRLRSLRAVCRCSPPGHRERSRRSSPNPAIMAAAVGASGVGYPGPRHLCRRSRCCGPCARWACSGAYRERSRRGHRSRGREDRDRPGNG